MDKVNIIIEKKLMFFEFYTDLICVNQSNQ